jgi:hypothetical protein
MVAELTLVSSLRMLSLFAVHSNLELIFVANLPTHGRILMENEDRCRRCSTLTNGTIRSSHPREGTEICAQVYCELRENAAHTNR